MPAMLRRIREVRACAWPESVVTFLGSREMTPGLQAALHTACFPGFLGEVRNTTLKSEPREKALSSPALRTRASSHLIEVRDFKRPKV